MGKRKLIAGCFLSALLIILAGCTAQTPPPETTEPSAQPVLATEETQPEEEVYGGATRDYLLPLADFSWQREHDPEMVMIHFTSGVVLNQKDPYNLETIRGIFQEYEISVHYVVDRDGSVYCYIPENLVAWHAGSGTWQDLEKYRNKMNHYAIGIEVLAIGSREDMEQYLTEEDYNSLNPDLIGYTDAQYTALKRLVADICRRQNIPMDRLHVIGHEDYAPQKTDPGTLFDWDRLMTKE